MVAQLNTARSPPLRAPRARGCGGVRGVSGRIVFHSFGSLGDLHPTLAIALELEARGHDVVVATHEMYRARVERERLGFHPVPPDFADLGDLDELFRRSMDGGKGSEFVLRKMVLPWTRAQFDALVEAARGADLLGHPPDRLRRARCG